MVRAINLKRFFWIFLSVLFIQSQAYGLNVRSIDQVVWTATEALRLQFPRGQVTKVGDQSFYVETGYQNILPNPNFEASTLAEGWNNTPGSSSFAVLDSGNQREGLRGVTVTMTSGIHSEMEAIYSTPVQAGVDWTGTNVAGWKWIKNSNAGMKLCLRRLNSSLSQEARSCVDLQADGVWHNYVTPGVTGGDSTKRYMLTVMKTGTIGVGNTQTFQVDGEAYIGPATNITQGTPPNEFTAEFSAAGVPSNQTPYTWITGNCVTSAGAGNYQCPTGSFTALPNCNVTVNNAGGNGYIGAYYKAGSTITSLYFITTSGGTGTSNSFTVTCTKTGSDIVQNAVSAPNWNFTDRTYTTTLSGLGTGSATVNRSTFSRSGAKGTVCIDATKDGSGGTGGTAVEASLPSGITVNSSYGSAVWVGSGFSTINSNNFTAFVDSTNNKVRFTLGSAVLSGSAWTASSNINGCVTFPAVENGVAWTETYNAPQLNYSVTSNSTSALRVEFVRFGGASGVNSNCTGSPCTIISSSGLSAPTRSSAGVYSVSLGSAFPVPPTCVCSAIQTGTSAFTTCAASGSSLSSTLINTGVSGVSVDTEVNVTCYGPR